MPRTARIVIPNQPHHVIQRGHNRQTVFFSDDDYRYYLRNLAEWKERLNCGIFAFCLMPDHVHLVVDPGSNPENLALLVKRLAGRQTRFVNASSGRSGTLWEGRYRSSPVDIKAYLLACCIYVEMNPVLARLCVFPSDYPWSSCSSKTGFPRYGWLDEDPHYLALGSTCEERWLKYGELLRRGVQGRKRELIRSAIQRGLLTGDEGFVAEIESRLNRKMELRGRGRPRKPAAPEFSR